MPLTRSYVECVWAPVDHVAPATWTLIVQRPCGHARRLAPSCDEHVERFRVGYAAPRATPCECGDVNSPQVVDRFKNHQSVV